MRILLVYPTKLGDDGKPVKYKKAFLPPLSLAIASGLTPSYHEVMVVNDLAEEIDYSIHYDLVGITSMTSQIERAYQIAHRFRSKGARVIMGGIHATILPQEVKQHADSVIIGEIEDIWEEILCDFENNNYKELYQGPSFPDLQKLVIPRFDSFNMKIYPKPIGYRLPIMPIFTTRGCPYVCDFCSVSKYFGRTYRVKPIANVLKEIDAISAQYYFFVDDNIAGNIDYSRELFKALIPKKIRWLSQISTTVLKNPDLIDLAAKAGCDCLLMGIESINKESLQSIHKGFNKPEQYGELFARLRKAGIIPYASIIFGFDHDTLEQFRYTLEFLMKHKVGLATFTILTPLPGTKLFERLKDEGRLLHQNWSMYDLNHIVHQPKNLTVKELYDSFWKTFQEFYSLKNITKRIFYNLTISSKPLMGFFEDLFYQLFYRKVVNTYEHPFSGGFGRLN